MELWIRSQDKERLIKTEDLYIEFNGDVDPTLQSYRIVTDKFIELGIYKNKERALEVLDEIQEHIENYGETFAESNNGIVSNFKYYGRVYEMPKE